MKSSDKKICVVTGANSGLGKWIAMDLATHGMHVVMICRDVVKGREVQLEIKNATNNTNIDLVIADLSSLKSIHDLSTELHQRYPAIHVLINNAGVASYQKKLSVDGIELTLATNYLAPILLTRLLLDLLKASAPARIINVSSQAHYSAKIDLDDLQFVKRPYKFFTAYANSKLLLNSMTFDLAKELQGTNVTVNAIHPGAIKTNLGKSKSNIFQNMLVNLIMLFFMDAKKSARYVVDLALSPKFADVNGQYFSLNKQKRPSDLALDPEFTKEVKKRTEELIKMSGDA